MSTTFMIFNYYFPFQISWYHYFPRIFWCFNFNKYYFLMLLVAFWNSLFHTDRNDCHKIPLQNYSLLGRGALQFLMLFGTANPSWKVITLLTALQPFNNTIAHNSRVFFYELCTYTKTEKRTEMQMRYRQYECIFRIHCRKNNIYLYICTC